MRASSNRYKPNAQINRDWKWVIGIDPGTHTGLAVYSVKMRGFSGLLTLTYWEAYEAVLEYPVEDTKVVIEVPTTNAVWQKLPKSGIGSIQRQAVNVGRVVREAELLAEGIGRAGYFVIRSNPIGKADKKRFQRITGFMGRLNQHQRDAGMMKNRGKIRASIGRNDVRLG